MKSNQSLIELFANQKTWQDRYRQIILLAKQIPEYPESFKQPEQQVQGCENKVWLAFNKNADGSLYFWGDSDGRIIKGLLAILLILINNKTAAEIQLIDFDNEFKQLNIWDEIGSSKQVGLVKIIGRIQKITQNS